MTDKMRLFADEYLVDRNATAAAKRAGYSSPRNAGYRVLHHPEVQKYIKGQEAKLASKLEITAERVLKEVARIAFSDITDYVDVENNSVKIKNFSGLDEDKARAVASVKQSIEVTEFKLHDKVAALDKLCRHLGLYKEKEVNFNIEQLLAMTPEDLEKFAEQLETSDVEGI